MGKKSKRRQRVRTGVCVYCGQTTTVEDDHLIPRALWPEQERNRVQFVRVEACRSCNSLKSKGEADLVAYAVLDKDGGDHPYASLLAPKVARSVQKGHANIAKAALSSTMTPLITRHGIYLGDYPWAEIDSTNMMQSLRMIVRGMYAFETGTVLPQDTPVDVWVIPSYSVGQVFGPLAQQPHAPPIILGDRVFWWVPFVVADDPTSSAWPMGVFDRVFFVGITGDQFLSRLPRRREVDPGTRIVRVTPSWDPRMMALPRVRSRK